MGFRCLPLLLAFLFTAQTVLSDFTDPPPPDDAATAKFVYYLGDHLIIKWETDSGKTDLLLLQDNNDNAYRLLGTWWSSPSQAWDGRPTGHLCRESK
jgi:hypothetical protein